MKGLTVGVTTAKHPDCKRGVATNLAATFARHESISARVVAVDADPFVQDVSTRLAVSGPVLEDFAKPKPPDVARLGHLPGDRLYVLPNAGQSVARVRLASERAIPLMQENFDFVVVDLPVGPTGPGRAVGARLELLDWLILAVTPAEPALEATIHFLEMFETAQARGEVGKVHLGIVSTGDESCERFQPDEIETMLGVSLAGTIPQLWGRAAPNVGFGPALAIPELDNAVYDLFMAMRVGMSHRPHMLTF